MSDELIRAAFQAEYPYQDIDIEANGNVAVLFARYSLIYTPVHENGNLFYVCPGTRGRIAVSRYPVRSVA